MSAPAPATPTQGLEQAILDHLDAHPRAADSAAGVARWWLGARGGQAASIERVERALDALAARGHLRRVQLADGTVLFSKEWTDRPH